MIHNKTTCAFPGVNNTDVLWIQYTGYNLLIAFIIMFSHDDVENLGSIVSYFGNQTIINIWNAEETVHGSDKRNFEPFIDSHSDLSIWVCILLLFFI